MKIPAKADLQRWSDDVARDPRSLAFLPLARAYRRQGLRDAARQLCLRGLQAYPSHVEAHGLLALLYLEAGESTRAADEWSIVLRMDADNFDALRGMGFCYLEQDQLSRARQTLERAALIRPSDPAVQEALRVLGTRQELLKEGLSAGMAPTGDDPWAAPGERVASPTGSPDSTSAAQSSQELMPGLADDPARLFDSLLSGGPLLGALLVDAQGLVLAGRLTEGVAGEGAVLGAVLGGVIGEATRTAQHLSLGEWRGILLEAEHALLHIAPIGGDAVVVLAAQRSAPAGWMLRTAVQASEQAAHHMEART